VRRFAAGVVVGVLIGAGGVAVVNDPAPVRASASAPSAAGGGPCDAIDQAIREAFREAAGTGGEATDRAKQIESQLKTVDGGPELCASDVDVLEVP
jgi:uncharacterized membrane protein